MSNNIFRDRIMRASHFRFFGTSFFRVHSLSSKSFLDFKKDVFSIESMKISYQDEILEFIAKENSKKLTGLLFKVYIFENYLENKSAIVFKGHHSKMDGMATIHALIRS